MSDEILGPGEYVIDDTDYIMTLEEYKEICKQLEMEFMRPLKDIAYYGNELKLTVEFEEKYQKLKREEQLPEGH